MAREKPDYRTNLSEIKAVYPGKTTLTIQEAAKIVRRDRRTLLKDKAFPALLIGGKYAISVTALAMYLST